MTFLDLFTFDCHEKVLTGNKEKHKIVRRQNTFVPNLRPRASDPLNLNSTWIYDKSADS